MTTQTKAMYTTREASSILSVCMKTLRGYITTGRLRAARRGSGDYLIHENSIRAFLELEPDETLACSVGDEP